jgi:hypothetical protein
MEIVNRSIETAVTREFYTVKLDDGTLILLTDTIDDCGFIIDTEITYVETGEVPDEETCEKVFEFVESNPQLR